MNLVQIAFNRRFMRSSWSLFLIGPPVPYRYLYSNIVRLLNACYVGVVTIFSEEEALMALIVA
jgi:hypothetical protein